LVVALRSFDAVLIGSPLPAEKATDGPRRGLEPSVLARAPRHKRSRVVFAMASRNVPAGGHCAP
jgi:hypothetical protein